MSVVHYPGFVIPSTTIAVDFWPKSKYDHLTHHFLTHAHTDHTQGLDSAWCGSSIYCSKVTKRILAHFNLVDPEWVVELEMDKVHVFKLDDDESFNLTLIDANHCPGAVMYLFQGYFGNVLATGDFRFDLDIIENSGLLTTEIETCFLDNTYFNELYADVPSRERASTDVIELIEKKRAAEPDLIVQVKVKKLGKEELLVKLSKHFATPVCVSKFAYEKCVDHLEMSSEHFTSQMSEQTFIFTDDVDTRAEEVKAVLAKRRVIVIEPSALRAPFAEKDQQFNNHFIVPYSDHSSYNEIVEFVKLIRPKKLVPIVRKPLPKNIDTSDLSVLDKYLNKKPLIDSHDTYKLLLQSKSSVRRSSRLKVFHQPLNDHDSKKSALRSRSFMLRKRKKSTESAAAAAAVVVNNKRLISVRSKKQKTEIEYESSPEKDCSGPEAAAAIKISCPNFYKGATTAKNNRRSARIKSLDHHKKTFGDKYRPRSLGSEPSDKSSIWLKVSEQLEIMASSSSESDGSFTSIPEEPTQTEDLASCALPSNQQARGPAAATPSQDSSAKKNDDFDTLFERYGHTLPVTRGRDSDCSSICIEHTVSETINSATETADQHQSTPPVVLFDRPTLEPTDDHEDQINNISLAGINLGGKDAPRTTKAPTPRKKRAQQQQPAGLGFLDFMSLRLNSAVQLGKPQADTRSFQDHCSNIRNFLFDSFKY